MKRIILVLILILSILSGCKKRRPHRENIGAATMQQDGTIILDLTAEGDNGTIGDARFVYPKSHPRYQEILRHLGGLSPGQSKPVPPWPDK
jgi:hypothetical protein